jgi:predicted enzyme related to lactoylglutathione lyase
LATSDWRAALTFYQRLFGWEETGAMDMGPGMGTYQMFGRNGRTLGGMFNAPAQMPGPPSWLPYIRVADAKGGATAIKKLGGRVTNGPMEVPGGDWITQGLDLQGTTFAVHAVKAAAETAAAPSKQAAAKRSSASPKTARKTASRRASAKPRAARRAPTKSRKGQTSRTRAAKPTTRRNAVSARRRQATRRGRKR